MKAKLSPDQKREYLRLLFSEGRDAVRTYLEQLECEEGGVFIFKSEAELEAFRQRLDRCCPEGSKGGWIFLPDNGRD